MVRHGLSVASVKGPASPDCRAEADSKTFLFSFTVADLWLCRRRRLLCRFTIGTGGHLGSAHRDSGASGFTKDNVNGNTDIILEYDYVH